MEEDLIKTTRDACAALQEANENLARAERARNEAVRRLNRAHAKVARYLMEALGDDNAEGVARQIGVIQARQLGLMSAVQEKIDENEGEPETRVA